jgi:hypothetical protein
VTAGSPRVGDAKMKEHVMDRMKVLGPMDRAVICRMVYNQDLVPHIPLNEFGYYHFNKLVYLSRDGQVIINPQLKQALNFDEVFGVFASFWDQEKKKSDSMTSNQDKQAENAVEMTPFEKECEKTAGPIKDVC